MAYKTLQRRLARMSALELISLAFKFLSGAIILLALGMLGLKISMDALDKSIDNQNVMLCESARRSGNEDWRTACAEYYRSGSVKYLRK